MPSPYCLNYPGSSVLQRIEPILRAIRAMLRPLSFPIMVEFVVLGVALVVLGLYLLFRGTLPQWLPSGYVDQAGKRAELSRPVYRMLGVTSVLAGGATPLLALSQRPVIVVLAFVLIAIGLICAIPAAGLAVRRQRGPSLRPEPSSPVLAAAGGIRCIALER